MLEVARDYKDDNLEEQLVRRGQDGDVQVCGGEGGQHGVQQVARGQEGDVQVCGGGGAGQLGGQQEV